MRNRNWDQDFEHINQSNVNRIHVNRDGQRQYDSGYRNNMGTTSFDRNMQERSHPDRNEWVNTSPNRYAAHPDRYDYAPSHRQARVDYDERRHLHNRHPEDNATDRGFFNRMGERVSEFWHEGRERMGQFMNREEEERYHRNQANTQNRSQNQRGNYPEYREQPYHDRRQNQYPNRQPQQGFESSPYAQGNQGHVQGNRYQPTDYSARSSYRLLDTYSGYGQSGGSYASDRDED